MTTGGANLARALGAAPFIVLGIAMCFLSEWLARAARGVGNVGIRVLK